MCILCWWDPCIRGKAKMPLVFWCSLVAWPGGHVILSMVLATVSKIGGPTGLGHWYTRDSATSKCTPVVRPNKKMHKTGNSWKEGISFIKLIVLLTNVYFLQKGQSGATSYTAQLCREQSASAASVHAIQTGIKTPQVYVCCSVNMILCVLSDFEITDRRQVRRL